jgi:hypothetical protein
MSEPLELVAEKERKKNEPWGEGVWLSVVFPCQVRQDAETLWEARCRELKITVSRYSSQGDAIEALRVAIRNLAAEARQSRIR